MPAWITALIQPLFDLLAKGLAVFGILLAGESRQQAKDEQKVIDAAKTRADVENANSKLDAAAVLAKLRADRG